MAKKKPERPTPHPDDLMLVAVSLAFQAKVNPNVEDPPPFESAEIEQAFSAADAADYLERVVVAIRERRLYGFLQQEAAESAVGAGQWIKKTTADIIAETRTKSAPVRLPNLQKIIL
jgi:hypothetical protein